MISRGIVISPPFQPLLGGGIRCGGQPDPSELRKYLLYWDQIDYPTNNLVHITSSDIEYLESTQALKRTRVVFEGASSTGRGEFFVQAQEAALRENLKIQPGAWSLAQLSESPHYTESTFGIGIDLELYGMLPVPTADTPLADILEFKQHRQDELQAFRCYMDDIYLKIIGAADIPRSKNTELCRLQTALVDLDKTLKEGKIFTFAGNIRNIFHTDFSGVVGTGLGAAGLSAFIGLPPLTLGLSAAGLLVGFRALTMPRWGSFPTSMNYLRSVRTNFHS